MRAAIYARYSSDRQRESSIDDQVRNCTNFSSRNSMNIVQVYQDKAITGAVMTRDGYQRMLTDAAAGHFEVLLVDDLSRLSRDKLEMERVLRKLTFAGMRIIGVSDGYDSASKGHKIHSGVKGLMNEIYLDDLRDKTHRGMSGQAIKGYNCGGRTYGYRNIPIEHPTRRDAYGRPAIVAVKYEIDPEQADIVRHIYEWYAAATSCKWIASELNAQHVPASRGGSWAMSAVKVILDNEMYEGRLIWNRKEWVKNPETGKRTYRERPRGEWIVTENEKLRIVSEEVMARVRRRQRKNKETYPGDFTTSSAQRYLFSGLMMCAECSGNFVLSGQNRYGCASNKTRGHSVCGNSHTVSRHIVEERLLDGIKKNLLAPDSVEKFKKAAMSIIESRRASAGQETAVKRLREAEQQRDNIMKAIRAGIVTETTKDALEGAEREIADLQRMVREGEQWKVSGILPRAVERYREAIGQLDKELSGCVASAREIIKSLMGERIRIHKREGYLVAEIPNSMPAILARAVGYSDLNGCGGGICSESEFISLETRLSDNTPLNKRKTVKFQLIK